MNNIRISVKDIIESGKIVDILKFLNLIYDHNAKFKTLKFWYDNILEKQLLFFESKLKEILNDEIKFDLTNHLPNREFVWFDIMNKNDYLKYRTQNRFTYILKNGDIINGIQKFQQMIDNVKNSRKKLIYKKENFAK